MKYTAPIQVKVSPETREAFQKANKENNINPSALLRSWIEKHIEENK